MWYDYVWDKWYDSVIYNKALEFTVWCEDARVEISAKAIILMYSYLSAIILFNDVTLSSRKINSTTCIQLLPTNARQLQQSPRVQLNAMELMSADRKQMNVLNSKVPDLPTVNLMAFTDTLDITAVSLLWLWLSNAKITSCATGWKILR